MSSKIMAEFQEVSRDRGGWLKAWKARTGQRVVGCFPMYVPEEVLHAAGLHPVILLGSEEQPSRVNEFLHSYLCHPVRSNLDQALKGELDYLDGLVFTDICDQAKRVGSIWGVKRPTPFLFYLMLPKRLDSPAAPAFLARELERLRQAAEDFAGKKVTAEALKQSIALYNETRSLLLRLFELRRKRPGLIGAGAVSAILDAAMTMPKEEFNPRLKKFLQASERAKAKPGGVRLLLAGNPCEDLEPGFATVLEELGAAVVADDLFPGNRYLFPLVQDGHPLEALAKAHLQVAPCPTRHHPGRDWADYLIGQARASGAQGMVILLQKFCEIHTFEYPDLKAKLAQAGIPHLMIESDHSGATARTKTRLEAFLETIREV